MNKFKTLEEIFEDINKPIIQEQMYKDGVQLVEQYLVRTFISKNTVLSHEKYSDISNMQGDEKRNALIELINNIITEKVNSAQEASGMNLTRESFDDESINALADSLLQE